MNRRSVELKVELRRALRRILRANPTKANYKFVMKEWRSLFDLEASSQVLETKRFTQNLKPLEIECPAQRKIMVIAPHPDDDIFGPGGTLLKAIQKGAEVHVVYVTDGENDARREAIRDDARRSCKALGATYTFLGCETMNIPLADEQVNRSLSSLLEDIRPEAIFTAFLLDDHDDHRRANELLLTVARDLDLGKAEIWAYQVYSGVLPNVVVNITEQAEEKRRLIGLWHNVSGNRDWAHYVLGMNAANCRYVPSRKPEYVEAFFVVPLGEYLNLCEGSFSHGADRIDFTGRYREGTAHGAATGPASERSRAKAA